MRFGSLFILSSSCKYSGFLERSNTSAMCFILTNKKTTVKSILMSTCEDKLFTVIGKNFPTNLLLSWSVKLGTRFFKFFANFIASSTKFIWHRAIILSRKLLSNASKMLQIKSEMCYCQIKVIAIPIGINK